MANTTYSGTISGTGAGSQWSSGTKYSSQTIDAGYQPSIITITLPTGSYVSDSGTATVGIYIGDNLVGTVALSNTSRSGTVQADRAHASWLGQTVNYRFISGNQIRNTVTETVYLNPMLLTQAVITSVTPAQGNSTTAVCSTAAFINMVGWDLFYQWFARTSPEYGDDGHVGGDATEPVHFYDKSSLLSKGATEGATMYLFVRAFAYKQDRSEAVGFESVPATASIVYNDDVTDTVKVFNGTTFLTCEVDAYDGTQWRECEIRFWDGTQWVECSH